MAAPNRVIVLNLGTQTVGLAEFRTGSNGGLILSRYWLTELLADPAADASRSAQMRVALKEMMDHFKIRSGSVNYAISAQSVFTRFVKLPAVGEDKVDQIIAFEAQQNVPFPIDEVVWDYQLVGAGGSENEKIEVVLVAIKSDLLDEVNDVVADSGLKTHIVDVAPMALFNAFRYSYSDVSDCSLLIDIGARTTTLTFIEPRKVFSRSIQIGGNTITAAIAKDFKEPYGAAEERKKKVGFVSLGGAYAEPSDPDVARVSKMVRNTMTRLHSEISRSISFYRAQQQGSAPTRVYLCGGSSALPYMREFFHEKLQLPVEFFNPLRNVAVGSDLNAQDVGKSAHVMGELVGLALRSVSECPMELNLRPASVVESARMAGRRPFIILAGICLLLSLAAFWLYYTQAAAAKSGVLGQLTPKVSQLRGLQAEIENVRTNKKAATELAQPLLTAVRERGYLVEVLSDLNQRLPERFIWITTLEAGYYAAAPDLKFTAFPTDPGAPEVKVPEGARVGLRLAGLYLDIPENTRGIAVVDDFVKRLAESPFLNLDLTKKSELNPVRTTPTGADWAYPYELRLFLKDPITFQ